MLVSSNAADAREAARPLDIEDPRLTIAVDAIVTLSGDLDRSVEDDVTRRVALTAESADRIEIDARGVTFFDAAGVRAFLLSKQSAHDHGVSVAFRFTRPGPVDRVLELLDLTELFTESVRTET